MTRYTTSAFMRAKLGEELAKRDVAPHVFETAAEAQAFLKESGSAGGDGIASAVVPPDVGRVGEA